MNQEIKHYQTKMLISFQVIDFQKIRTQKIKLGLEIIRIL